MQNPRNSLAHVYVIENTLGVVKVGIATNPAKRFRAITASSGLPIVQSHLSPLCLNYLAVEKALLAYFKDFRVQGEWLQGIDYKTVCSALDSHFSSLPATVESQSNSPVIFDFENHQLRTINKGETVWFVAKDVCDALELSDVSMSVARLDDDEKGTCKVCTLGGEQSLLCINESGLYALILRSNKPQAKPFRKWITSEVIPSIRKTGGYGNHDLITQVYELQRQVSAIQSLIPTNLINSIRDTGVPESRFSRDVENLKRFYQECTTNDMNAYLPIGTIGFSRTTHLYPAYVAWCEREGVRGVSLNYFARTSIRAIKCLGWQGINHDKTRTGKVIRGVRFISGAVNHG